MANYIYKHTKLPNYIPMPRFLVDMPISSTAKLVYASLYGRILLSKQNDWVDESGRVYVMYTIASMAAEIGKSETTIKNAYKELEKVGLLQRVTTIKGKPNRLYVMLPEDNIGQIMDGGKLSVDEAENSPWVGKKTTCDTGRKLSSNYINSKNNNISNKYIYSKEESL